jgi:hypothetical protein
VNTRTHRFPVGYGAAEQVLDRVDGVPSGARLRVAVPGRRLLRGELGRVE